MTNNTNKNWTPEELNYLRVHTCITWNTCESKDKVPENFIYLGERVFTNKEGITNDYSICMWNGEVDAWLEFFRKRSINHNVAEDFKTLIKTNIKYGVWEKEDEEMFMKDLEDVKKLKIDFEDVKDYAKHPYERGTYKNGKNRSNNPIYDLDTVVREQLSDMYDDEFIKNWIWKEVA